MHDRGSKSIWFFVIQPRPTATASFAIAALIVIQNTAGDVYTTLPPRPAPPMAP